MGNDHQSEEAYSVEFLLHPNAKSVFARLDFALKDGMHIQNRAGQENFYHFIQENEESLRAYYQLYFGINLDSGGSAPYNYYYLDFMPLSRGNIPTEHRYFLQNEYVIVGFLLYKVVYIDKNIELSSVKVLQKMIRQDYEELKPGIYRTLAKSRSDKSNKMNDDRVEEVILKALNEFKKIGWVTLDGDVIDILPAFDRLPKIYSDIINNLDEWFNQE